MTMHPTRTFPASAQAPPSKGYVSTAPCSPGPLRRQRSARGRRRAVRAEDAAPCGRTPPTAGRGGKARCRHCRQSEGVGLSHVKTCWRKSARRSCAFAPSTGRGMFVCLARWLVEKQTNKATWTSWWKSSRDEASSIWEDFSMCWSNCLAAPWMW